MPITHNRDLTLTTTGANTDVIVRYHVVFSPFERFLVSNGLQFREKISVKGVDGAVSNVLHNSPYHDLTPEISAGVAPLNMPLELERTRELTYTRDSLQEDPALGDNDEIKCTITIEPYGMPYTITGDTDTEVLLG